MGVHYNVFLRNDETKSYVNNILNLGKALQPGDVKDIDDFVSGIKDFGLWDNMVCWPLRSIHNIGTGNRVNSLGGLGTFNGTMINGPTWGTDGVTFPSGIQSSISTSLSGWPSSPNAVFASYKTDANSTAQIDFNLGGNYGFQNRAFAVGSPMGANARSIGALLPGFAWVFFSFNSQYRINGNDQALPLNAFASFSINLTSGNNGSIFVDSTLATSGGQSSFDSVGVPGTGTFYFGKTNSANFTSVLPFLAHFRGVSITNSQVNLHNLYKQTIGKGLGLP
jgi:hypothetical protein